MEEERDNNRIESVPSSSLIIDEEEEEEENNHGQDEQQLGVSSYWLNLNTYVSNVGSCVRDDLCSSLIVLFTFWFFASMTMILGFYGSVKLPLSPNCSHLLQINSLFVQSIKVSEMDKPTHNSVLFGFYESPPLDGEITWSEMHNAFVQPNQHKEWSYFLNEGSTVDISYSVKNPASVPLSLVIAQGKESLSYWIEDPSYPNTTLSWNIIHGNGMIHQNISTPKTYHIALGNLNPEEVEVQLNFTMKASVYNTTQANYRCSLSHQECSLELFLTRENFALLTSPGPDQGMADHEGYVKLSYGPRWFIYLVGSGIMTILMILASRICSFFDIIRQDRTRQTRETRSEQAPFLLRKDDDLSSLGSSYGSISPDEEDLDKLLVMASTDGKQPKEGDSIYNPSCLCVICFDASRDCFFLPCGHSVACFTCGKRVIEEAGNCPICSRTTKKVRQIINV